VKEPSLKGKCCSGHEKKERMDRLIKHDVWRRGTRVAMEEESLTGKGFSRKGEPEVCQKVSRWPARKLKGVVELPIRTTGEDHA